MIKTYQKGATGLFQHQKIHKFSQKKGPVYSHFKVVKLYPFGIKIESAFFKIFSGVFMVRFTVNFILPYS